jgi:hypothetical protein
MNIKSIKSSVYRNLINIPGWRTNRKIVVIESDDWGSIRMASKGAYNDLLKRGIPVEKSIYNRYDALECNDDLDSLFEVLSSVRDSQGNPAVITVNTVMANPDFDKIRDCDFMEYHYEPFIKTLERYPQHDKVYDLYKSGIQNGLIKPQFHGREHVNIGRWMKDLQLLNQYAHMAFNMNMFSMNYSNEIKYCREVYLDAFGAATYKEHCELKSVIKDGMSLFRELWGFSSVSAIAPCYIWDSEIEKILNAEGVKIIQGTTIQNLPILTGTRYIKKYHYTGQYNSLGQLYVVRNCFFEPSNSPSINNVSYCLKNIELAFKYGKPAIISSHRVNYMGFIDPSNRKKNLKELAELLTSITCLWPEVEFMSTDQLGNVIYK